MYFSSVFIIIIYSLSLSVINCSYIPPLLSNSEEFVIDYDDGKCRIMRCKDTSLCSSHSKCGDDGQCICDKGYTTKEEDGIIYCCYAQKGKYKAFVYEFFLGFGIGHKYIGNESLFYAKFITYIILFITAICFLIQSFFFKSDEISFKMKFIRTVFALLCGCTFVCWQIVDGVMMMMNGYRDKNGVELANMF